MPNDFLKIKKVDNYGSDYFYAERLGVDSIAFVLLNIDRINRNAEDFVGVIHEFKPPIQQSLTTAFGGSLDKDYSDLTDIVKAEVLEESGYKVKDENITPLGRVFVSTQMNQFCHLFAVEVREYQFEGRKPENSSEAAAEVKWLKAEEVHELEDWKAFTILSRIFTKKENEAYAEMDKKANSKIIMP